MPLCIFYPVSSSGVVLQNCSEVNLIVCRLTLLQSSYGVFSPSLPEPLTSPFTALSNSHLSIISIFIAGYGQNHSFSIHAILSFSSLHKQNHMLCNCCDWLSPFHLAQFPEDSSRLSCASAVCCDLFQNHILSFSSVIVC